MPQLGVILFVLGIFLSVIGAAKVPTELGGWPNTVPLFAMGAVLATLGLFLWYGQRRKELAAEDPALLTGKQDPFSLLQGAQEPLSLLSADIGSLDADQITERVDEILEGWILPFAAIRQKVIDRIGMVKGAEILVVVAYGERMLNRVWSAAGDGHLPEARACLPEAHEALTEAAQLAEAAVAES